MKTSLNAIVARTKPSPTKPAAVALTAPKSYRTAQTRATSRQLSGHFAGDVVQAFRMMAATVDMDMWELPGDAINMTVERRGIPNRIENKSERRKRD